MDDSDLDFSLSLEDEFRSIDRLIQQANEFLYEFGTPPANSTIVQSQSDATSNESSTVDVITTDDTPSDVIINISESITTPTEAPASAAQQSTVSSESERIPVANQIPNIDDDVICVELLNPTVIDYIDLCSPMSVRTIQQPVKRNARGRRSTDAAIPVDNTVNAPRTSNDNEEPQDKRAKEITCRICFESLFDRVTMSTACGHIFCKTCLDQVLKIQKKCPMCKSMLNKNRVFRIYL